jgi:Holliday junction resolvase RusA-like endonuclease
MVTVETPASFQWNDTNSHWVKNYLMPKSDLLVTLTDGVDLSLNEMTEDKFTQLCQLLETTAEGRELRNKMFKAWRSKKSRDSDNGKKLYTFNLSIKAGEQLKKVAKQAPLNQTLESLIFAGKINSGHDEKLQQQLTQCKLENERLQKQLSDALQKTQTVNDDAEIESLINSDLQVTELAKLEKSKLIKQILMLKRKK